MTSILCDANLEGALQRAAHINLVSKDLAQATGRAAKSPLYQMNAGMRHSLSLLQINHQKTIFPELIPYWQSVKSMMEIRSIIGNKHYPSTRDLGNLSTPETLLLTRALEAEDAARKILAKRNPDGSVTITVPTGAYDLSRAGDVITLPPKVAAVRDQMRAAFDDLYAGYVTAMKVKLGFNPSVTTEQLLADPETESAGRLLQVLEDLYHPGYLPHVRSGRYGLKYKLDGREMYEAPEGSGLTLAAQDRDALRKTEALRASLVGRPGVTELGRVFDARNLDDLYKNLPDSAYLENINMVLQALVSPQRGEARETVDKLMRKLTEIAEAKKTGRLQKRRDVGGWLNKENAATYLKATYPAYVFTMAHSISNTATERQRAEAIADIPSRDVRRLADEHNNYMYTDESQEAALRALTYYYTMGGNLSSAVLQLVQAPQVGIPFLAPHAGIGRTTVEMARASNTVLSAMRASFRADKVFAMERLKEDADVKAMLQKMMDLGYLQPMVTRDQAPAFLEKHSSEAVNALGRRFGRVLEVLGLGFQATEQASRMIIAITTYKLANNPAVLQSMAKTARAVGDKVETREDAVKFALEKVNFFQGPEVRQKAFRGYASVVTQFQSFPINMLWNWIEAARYYGGDGILKSPEGRKVLGLMMAGIFMTSGVWGLPFASSTADLLDFLLGQIAKTPIGAALGLSPTALQAQLQESLTEILKEMGMLEEGEPAKLASMFFNGPFRAAGVDISKRTGLEMIQGNPLQFDIFSLGPFSSAVLGGAKDASNYMSKDMPMMALASLFPVAVRNVARAVEMRDTGYITPGKIEPALPASELQDIPTAIAVALGFTPTRIAEARDAKREAKEIGTRMDSLRKSYSDSIATNIAAASQARTPEDVRKYERRVEELFQEIARRDEGKEPDARIILDNQAFITSIRNKVKQYLVPESGKGVPKVTRGAYVERTQ
jgi:hypothetical protein